MLADLDDLQSARVIIGQHNDTRRWSVIVLFADGKIWESAETFAEPGQAQASADLWITHINGKPPTVH